MKILIRVILSIAAVLVAAYILPGVHVVDFKTAAVLAIVLAIINIFLKPILFVLTLPLSILTLGLFTFVINALLILLAAKIVPGFSVDSFWWALLFSLVLSLVHSLFHRLEKKD
jgi:putative membrane protein